MNNNNDKFILNYEETAEAFRKAVKLTSKCQFTPLYYVEDWQTLQVNVCDRFELKEFPGRYFHVSAGYSIPVSSDSITVYEKQSELKYFHFYTWEKGLASSTYKNVEFRTRVTLEMIQNHSLISISQLKKFENYFSTLSNTHSGRLKIKAMKDFMVDFLKKEAERKAEKAEAINA